VLRPHLLATEWEVVAQIAVQLLDRNVDGGADDFLRLVLRCPEMTTLATRVREFAANLTQRRGKDLTTWITTTRLDALPGFDS
jgi:hypothetical protein